MGKLSPATLLWPSSPLFASIMKIHDLTPSRKGKKMHFQELHSLGIPVPFPPKKSAT
jgi:hypothetical protein